jgi:hypothetical protein
MIKEKRDIWFPAKEYGWGWGLPCAWQGWVVMLVYIGIVVGATIFFWPALNNKLYLVFVLGLSFLYGLVCCWKGEKPAWKWETTNNGIQQDEGRPLLPATTPEGRRWDVGRGTYPVLERFIQKENPV